MIKSRNLRSIAFGALALAWALSAGAQPSGVPDLDVCVFSRSDGAIAGTPSTIYRVTVTWNGATWQKGERVDIGMWDHSGLIWRQGHFADIRRGARQTKHNVVVQDAGVYPMTFGIIKMTPELVREADILCQRGFCSLISDAPGLTELSDPISREDLPLDGPGLMKPCT